MKVLITRKTIFLGLTNDLTKEMDEYLIENIDNDFMTYIFSKKRKNSTWSIRYPGATYGAIKVDEYDIIEYIKVSHEKYRPEVDDIFKKYIGMKLVIMEDEKNENI